MVVAAVGVGAAVGGTLAEHNPSLVAVGERGWVRVGGRGRVAAVPRGVPARGGPPARCSRPSSTSWWDYEMQL